MMLQQVVTAVSYIHACGVAHLDLKPANILLRNGTHVVLTDFELSREHATGMTTAGMSVLRCVHP